MGQEVNKNPEAGRLREPFFSLDFACAHGFEILLDFLGGSLGQQGYHYDYDAGEDEAREWARMLNNRDGTNYEPKYKNAVDTRGNSFIASLSTNALKHMPKEAKTWSGLKRAGGGQERAIMPYINNDKLTSNDMIKDLLLNYDFNLGAQK